MSKIVTKNKIIIKLCNLVFLQNGTAYLETLLFLEKKSYIDLSSISASFDHQKIDLLSSKIPFTKSFDFIYLKLGWFFQSY